jgi:superfamily II DNA/RNA helicase
MSLNNNATTIPSLPDNNNNHDNPKIENWDELDISSELLRGIYGYGFEKPSPIQQQAITPILKGKDIIAQAQSGTGKTATFTIGLLNAVNTTEMNTQILVLSPTRELSTQTANVIKQIGSMITGLTIQTLVGGTYVEEDISTFKKNIPHVVVGCPGRVFDMMRRNVIVSKKIKMVVIDEADEMLSAGFKEQLYNIFQYFNNEIQVVLFSATLPENIFEITDKFMRNPVKITIKADRLTLEGISQYFVALDDDMQKYSTLKDLFTFISLSQSIIYCNSVKRVMDLYTAMKEDNFPVCCIHSAMEKAERDESFTNFRTGKSRVLISSNVTARGIDIQQVSVVINFDVPKCVHTYLHRIGRSGRWGRKGVGLNFITRRDVYKIKEIEEYYACEINELPAKLENIIR